MTSPLYRIIYSDYYIGLTVSFSDASSYQSYNNRHLGGGQRARCRVRSSSLFFRDSDYWSVRVVGYGGWLQTT